MILLYIHIEEFFYKYNIFLIYTTRYIQNFNTSRLIHVRAGSVPDEVNPLNMNFHHIQDSNPRLYWMEINVLPSQLTCINVTRKSQFDFAVSNIYGNCSMDGSVLILLFNLINWHFIPLACHEGKNSSNHYGWLSQSASMLT